MLDLVARLAAAVDHDDAFQAGPLVAFLQPGELSRILRRLFGSNFAGHVTWCTPAFLGETSRPFLGADLHGGVPAVAGVVEGGSAPRAAWMP